ncbi:MAG: hypothetical protein HQ517_11930 [SAR324 cluster bacterium]|nr:hypothetical protein [SAR324 cluster bacterium]
MKQNARRIIPAVFHCPHHSEEYWYSNLIKSGNKFQQP